jgi:hypothetical protein
VLKAAGLLSAVWYTESRAKQEKQRPSPKPVVDDETLLAAVRVDLAARHSATPRKKPAGL